MHISVDQQGTIREREDARVAALLDRMDLRASPRHIAAVLVRRGMVRLPSVAGRTLAEVQAAQDELVVRLSCVAVAEGARTGRAWVAAARKAVHGWVPSRWTVRETETTEEQVVHVRRLA